jgi:outer membrane protein assembly factor BamB
MMIAAAQRSERQHFVGHATKHRTLLAAVLVGLLVSALTVIGQDWRGFHGLERQGVCQDGATLVTGAGQMDSSWKTPIRGFGFSSPVVGRDKIYLTTAYETASGSALRTATALSSVVLAWSLLIITSVISIRAAANDWSGRLIFLNGVRLILLMTVALLVLEMCLFADGLFDLRYSIVRSWKIGTAVSSLSLVMALLLAPRQTLPSLIFGVAATLLSVFAYLLMPKPKTFLDFGTYEGIASTGVVLAPALVAWAVWLTWFFAREAFPRPETDGPQASMRSRSIRTTLCCGLPALLTLAVSSALVQRMLSTINSWQWRAADEPTIVVRFEPALGWTFFTLSAILSLGAIAVGSLLLFKRPSLRRPLLACGAMVSVLLGLSCFLWFDAFPLKRHVTYAVVCLDKAAGRIQWLREVGESASLNDYKGANSHATPTIALGTDGLCAYFGSGGLFGLDLAGNMRWKVRDAEFDSPYGVGHSPVVDEDVILLANDNETYPAAQKSLGSHLIAYNLGNGREIWRQARDRSQPGSAGFSTPVVRVIRGRKTVLMRGWEDLTAYDLHTGQVLWTYRLKHSGNFLVAGIVTDGTRAYVLDALGVKALAFDALAQGGDPVVWKAQVPGEKIASAVLAEGLLFLATSTGMAFCIDASTGAVEWKHRLGTRFFSSIIAQGNRVVFTDESGNLSIVVRGRKLEIAGQQGLGEKVYATPAPQSDGLLVRAVTNLHYLRPLSPAPNGGDRGSVEIRQAR